MEQAAARYSEDGAQQWVKDYTKVPRDENVRQHSIPGPMEFLQPHAKGACWFCLISKLP